MQKRNTALARALAATALLGGALVVILVIATSLGGGESSGSKPSRAPARVIHRVAAGANVPASYVVQNGDTLLSIAHKTGVPLARIQALNPHVDPQILISGERLRLR